MPTTLPAHPYRWGASDMLPTETRACLEYLDRRSNAASQAGDALALRIMREADRYPDLVPLARAVLAPVVDCDQEAA